MTVSCTFRMTSALSGVGTSTGGIIRRPVRTGSNARIITVPQASPNLRKTHMPKDVKANMDDRCFTGESC